VGQEGHDSLCHHIIDHLRHFSQLRLHICILLLLPLCSILLALGKIQTRSAT
jgi:hypothetical protein